MTTFKFTKHMSEERACDMRGNAFTGFISIVATPTPEDTVARKAKLNANWGSILRLWFDDIEQPWQNYVMFAENQADGVIRWLKQHEDDFKGVLVHCAQGISRSAAMARFIAKAYGLPFDEDAGNLYNRHVFNMLAKRWKAHGYGEIQEEIYLAYTGASYAYTTGR